MSLLFKSSAWETGVGNFPAEQEGSMSNNEKYGTAGKHTLGKTGAKQTGDLLDQSLGCKESVVLLGELFNELLVLVQPEARRAS